MLLYTGVPDPTKVLPSPGFTEVLVKAAASHPVTALLICGVIVLGAFGMACWAIVQGFKWRAMMKPHVGDALVRIKQVDNEHKEFRLKHDKAKKAKKQR